MRILSLLFVVFVSACSSGSSGGGNATPLPEDDYCGRYVDEVCKIIVPCCSAISSPTSDTSCRSSFGAQCQSDRDHAKSLGLEFDGQAAGNCVSAISTYVVDCKSRPSTDPLSIALNASCNKVYVGAVPAGGACTTPTQCVHPASSSVSCDAGKCVVRALPKLDEPCGPSAMAFVCAEGAFCDGSKCVALPTAGNPCGGPGQCASGNYCDAGKVCQSKKPVGSTCSSSIECTGFCTGGLCALEPVTTAAQCKDIAAGKL